MTSECVQALKSRRKTNGWDITMYVVPRKLTSRFFKNASELLENLEEMFHRVTLVVVVL